MFLFANFVSIAFALLPTLLVRADVTPTTPDSSSVYDEGSTCDIAWTGDASGDWADMTIQLMSGDNLDMINVTTVATAQDGNSDGTYSYDCPSVTPNSAIYFYQFTAPAAENTTWTTRFAIAAADGSTTDPVNSTQTDGEAIPWGVGTLDSTSSATVSLSASRSSSDDMARSSASASVTASAAAVVESSGALPNAEALPLGMILGFLVWLMAPC